MALQKIFFSYSRIDGAQFAFRLATDLKEEQFDVWIDQEDIRAGSEWDLEIEKALENCDFLLFIETASSVKSENVLDEVYYALEQRKKVIPLIVVDSKTPYRLQRLQHIDFTTNYEKGLAQLVKELKGETSSIAYEEISNPPISTLPKPFIKKHRNLILLISLIVIAISIALVFISKSNNNKPVQHEITSNTNDSVTNNQPAVNDLKNEPVANDVITPEPNNKTTKRPVTSNQKITNKQTVGNPVESPAVLPEPAANYAGEWALAGVEPGVKGFDGYLKITPATDGKYNIRTHTRFFYHKTNDTSYLTIFNSFAGCASCDLQPQMKINTEDIAIGSNYFKILKNDLPPDGKAGDTVMSAGGNKSVRGAYTLHFINNKTAEIKVQRTTPVELSYGLMLNPFLYTFKFTREED
ncbi:MAG: toll/interleukin-1 receptor domain-containing protein [Ferruginibacter sp.]